MTRVNVMSKETETGGKIDHGFDLRTTSVQTLFPSQAQGTSIRWKAETSEVRKTNKNCAEEVPEGNSMTFAAALCNIGLKLYSKAFIIA